MEVGFDMEDSIFITIKKMLGIGEDIDAFDTDILVHINSSLTTLHQIGVGPPNGFTVIDETQTWSDFLSDDQLLNSVKTYLFLKLRLLFDPPTNSFLIDSINRELREIEWRLNITAEGGS